jgi:hypothetical protein
VLKKKECDHAAALPHANNQIKEKAESKNKTKGEKRNKMGLL